MDSQKAKNPYYKNDPDLRFAVITAEQEKILFSRMKEGDEQARTFLIENHLLFAQTESLKLAGKRLPEDEVISAANEALMTCIDRFDPNQGARFTTYLRYYLRRAVCDIWHRLDPVNYKRRFPKAESLESLKTPPGEIEEPSVTPDYAQDEFNQIALELLEKFKAKLEPREQVLLSLVYGQNLSFAEIGRKVGCSREAIRIQHDKALKKLRSWFKRSTELQ